MPSKSSPALRKRRGGGGGLRREIHKRSKGSSRLALQFVFLAVSALFMMTLLQFVTVNQSLESPAAATTMDNPQKVASQQEQTAVQETPKLASSAMEEALSEQKRLHREHNAKQLRTCTFSPSTLSNERLIYTSESGLWILPATGSLTSTGTGRWKNEEVVGFAHNFILDQRERETSYLR